MNNSDLNLLLINDLQEQLDEQENVLRDIQLWQWYQAQGIDPERIVEMEFDSFIRNTVMQFRDRKDAEMKSKLLLFAILVVLCGAGISYGIGSLLSIHQETCYAISSTAIAVAVALVVVIAILLHNNRPVDKFKVEKSYCWHLAEKMLPVHERINIRHETEQFLIYAEENYEPKSYKILEGINKFRQRITSKLSVKPLTQYPKQTTLAWICPSCDLPNTDSDEHCFKCGNKRT